MIQLDNKKPTTTSSSAVLEEHDDLSYWASMYLTPQELERFRGLLMAKRQKIDNQIVFIQNEAMNKEPLDKSSENETADVFNEEIQDQSLTFGQIDSKRVMIREIDKALGRIENGTYGICQSTQRMISKTVLLSMPWATYSYDE